MKLRQYPDEANPVWICRPANFNRERLFSAVERGKKVRFHLSQELTYVIVPNGDWTYICSNGDQLGHGLGAHAHKYPDQVIWTLIMVNTMDLLKYWKENQQSTAGLHLADIFHKTRNNWLHEPAIEVVGKWHYNKVVDKVGWDWAEQIVYV